jgi:CubicO group peptidase (beta-lactamase class C family)
MKIKEILDKSLEENVATGLAFAVLRKDKVIFEYTAGKTGEEGEPINENTLFDLASLTKVVFTTPVILRLVEDGLISLKDPISYYLKDFPTNVTLLNLITHTAGLKAWIPLFSDDLSLTTEEPHDVKIITKTEALEKIKKFGFVRLPNEVVEYSDLGFILLGFIIEDVLQKPLKEIAREFYDDLGMFDTGFEAKGSVVETELVKGIHIKGVVHDENARALGGASGHAGLFSNLKDLETFSLLILNEGKFLDKTLLTPFSFKLIRTTFTEGLNEERTVGFVKGRSLNIAPDFAPDDSIGHSGFTGTSIFFDFENSISIILLTNRVYFGRKNMLHMHLRRIVSNKVYTELL